MAWYDGIINWLLDPGLKIAIAILIGVACYVGWGIVCKLLIKALVTSTIKAREAVMRSKYKMQQTAKHGGKHFSRMSQDFGGKIKHKLRDKSMDYDNENSKIDEDNEIKTSDNDYKSLAMKSNSADSGGTGGGDNGGTEIKHTDENGNEVTLDVEFETIKLSDDIRLAMEERANTIGGVVRGIGNFAICVITGISLLDAIGVSTTPLLTIAALGGLGIALAAEDVIGDFIGGMIILAENQYFHGEIVNINGYVGAVEDFTLRTTKLRAKNGDLRIIPNGEIRELTNKSRVFSLAVVTVTVPYATEEDYDKAEDCLSNVVVPRLKDDESVTKVLYTPHIGVKAYSLEEDTIKIRMSVKVRTGFAATVQNKMMKAIRLEFPKREITISAIQSGAKAQNPDDDEEESESESDGPF